MTIPTGPRTASLYHASELAAGSVFAPARAVMILISGFVAFIVITGAVANTSGSVAWAVIAGEATLVAVPIAFVVANRGTPAMIGLRRPAGRFVLAALLIGSSQWFINLVVVDLIDTHVGLSERGVERLQDVVGQPPLVLALLAIAVLPALGEEVLFRGVLVRALATRLVPVASIAISALVFSAFHLSLIQAVPTFLLGLVYGYLALRARSAVPTMLAHLVNNSLAILVARGELPWLASAMERNTVAVLAVALALTAAGLTLIGLPARGRA